jgi:hypothetical protein
MPRIRVRYPLALLLVLSLYALVGDISITPTQPSQIIKAPPLPPGFYLVLHTNASLPDNIPAIHEKHFTYVGPLSHVKSCHEMRAKTKPLYPGVITDIIKVNRTTQPE